MSTRLAQRLFTAALLAAGATAVAAGPANAGVTPTVAAHPASVGHHHGENCNNDPDSEFAMDPEFCPPSNNADAYQGDYGYPGDYGYGYDYPGRY